MRELLMNARLICPLQNIDANGWLLIENGIIADGNGSADNSIAADKITDCKGQIIGPGFVDMRVQSGYPALNILKLWTVFCSQQPQGDLNCCSAALNSACY